VTLRDYIDRGLGDLARYHDAGITGLQTELDRRLGEVQRETEGRFREQAAAVLAATSALDKRLDAMNEFRESVRDITGRKIDADLFRQTTDALLSRLERAEAALERQRGRMGAYAAVSVFLVTAVTVLTLVLNQIRF
jgi:hypothetical protein